MFKSKCDNCGQNYNIKNARVDEHWRNAWHDGAAYCYCPHCNEAIKYLKPETVELIQKLTFTNITIIIFIFFTLFIGEATETLTFVAPIVIASFGIFLIKKSKLKDHRIIGWLLTIISTILLIFLNA